MALTTTRPVWVARLVTVSLWAVGSAYLLKSETDPVAMISTPVVWAAIIALPILAAYARRAGLYLACGMIWLAAFVGSAYTLNGTMGRQAEVRDVRMARASEDSAARKRIERDLSDAKAMLATAREKCAKGNVCLPATLATIGVYEGAVAGHEARLSKLKTSAPDAGEIRVARLLAFLTGAKLENVMEIVGLVSPSLFGLTLELAAFAVAMMGWHPRSENDTKITAAISVSANVHPVVAALKRAGRPVSNTELAELMGVTGGEATKRRREVSSLLREFRAGKFVMVALA